MMALSLPCQLGDLPDMIQPPLLGVMNATSAVKWSQRWRGSGSAAAKQMGGWRPLRLQRERVAVGADRENRT
jgi:hypothetical protein